MMDSIDEAVLDKPKIKITTPPMYRVLIHNDDVTTMEFVVHLLQEIFYKDESEATRIMMQTHHDGIGECGVFDFEIAETKVDETQTMARMFGFPLKSSMEEV